jgi:hypothetical protein
LCEEAHLNLAYQCFCRIGRRLPVAAASHWPRAVR